MYNMNEGLGEINFRDFLGAATGKGMQDQKGRVKYDEFGNIIDPDERRKAQAIRNNPHDLRPGNAINPDTEFADRVFAKGNKSFGGSGLQDQYKQARGM